MNITSYAKDLFEENYNTEYNSVCIDKTGKKGLPQNIRK